MIVHHFPRRWAPPLSLPAQRVALLARIHAGRQQSVEAGRRIAADLRATERSRRSIIAGLKLAKPAMVAAGVIWSLNAPSRMGRGRRLFTLAVTLLSAIRTLRNVRAFLIPLASSPERQE